MSKKKNETAAIEQQELQDTVDASIETEDESPSNAGLLVSVRDLLAKKEANRQRIDTERAIRQANPSGSRISRLKVMADTPYYVKFLHEYDKGLELFIHVWRGDEPCNEICKLHYSEPCDICTAVGTKYGESYHVPVRCFLGWVYNSVGGSFTKKDDRTGETKTYNLNPIKLIQIPLGKEDCNITILQEAARRKYFHEDIWQIERKKGKGFAVPKTIDTGKLRELVGRDVPLELSEAAHKIGQEDKLSTMTMILTAFDNVQWAKLGLKPPGGVNPTFAEIQEKAPVLEVQDGLD